MEPLPLVINQSVALKNTNNSSKAPRNWKTSLKDNKVDVKEPQNILLTSGNLEVSLNFPADAVVKFREKNKETVLMRGLCFCKSTSAQVC